MSYENTVILLLSCLVAILFVVIAHRQFLLSRLQLERVDPKQRFEGEINAPHLGTSGSGNDQSEDLRENLDTLEIRLAALSDSVESLRSSGNGELEATVIDQAERITKLGAQLSRLKGEVTRVKKELRGQLPLNGEDKRPETKGKEAGA